MDDADLSNEDLFFNSFFLNAKGRKVFSEKVFLMIFIQQKNNDSDYR